MARSRILPVNPDNDTRIPQGYCCCTFHFSGRFNFANFSGPARSHLVCRESIAIPRCAGAPGGPGQWGDLYNNRIIVLSCQIWTSSWYENNPAWELRNRAMSHFIYVSYIFKSYELSNNVMAWRQCITGMARIDSLLFIKPITKSLVS